MGVRRQRKQVKFTSREPRKHALLSKGKTRVLNLTMLSIDENARRKFESDWLSGRSLSIRDYLPQDSTDSYLGTLEELVCIDLEFRWKPKAEGHSKSNQTVSLDQAEIPTRVEDYVREFPVLASEEILQRLVEQEIYVRVKAGYVVEPSEYRSRFPGIAVDDSLFTSPGDVTHADPELAQRMEDIQFPFEFGKYTLLGQLGRGGMGAVYRAKQRTTEREVALKIAEVQSLSPQGKKLMVERFDQEARTAAALAHDHIVPIFDVGSVDGKPYIAMQLVEGGDLGALSKEEPFTSKTAAQYMSGIARGMAAAHAKGMLHRDIKPQNVLIDRTKNRALLTDFGLARYLEDDSGLTQTGQLLGTPSFMPPEQIRNSSDIDARADVYSLGGTIYQLITGRAPFKAANVHETLRQVVSTDPVPPKTINPDVDRDLDTICMKCLEKEPQARYQSASELADEIDRFLRGEPILARPVGPVRKAVKWCRRNRGLATASALALVSMITIPIVLLIANMQLDEKNTTLSNTLDGAIQVVREQYVDIRDEPLLTMPGVEAMREKLLSDSVRHYQTFIDLTEHDADFAAERAFAQSAIAEVMFELHANKTKLKAELASAKAALNELPNETQNLPNLLEARSNVELALGRLAGADQQPQEMLEHFRACTRLRQRWVDLVTDQLEPKRKLANALMNEGLALRSIGQGHMQTGNTQEARNQYSAAEGKFLEAQDIRAGLDQTNQRVRRDRGRAEYNFAFLELHQGDVAEAVFRLNQASDIFGPLAQEVRLDSRLWTDYIDSRTRCAELMTELPGFAQDEELRGKAAALTNDALNDLIGLIQLSDATPAYQLSLVSQYQRGIDSLLTVGAAATAEDHLTLFEKLMQETIAGLPGDDDELAERSRIVEIHYRKHQALLSFDLDNPQRSLASIERAIEAYSQAADLVKKDPLLQYDLSVLESLLKQLHSRGTAEPSTNN